MAKIKRFWQKNLFTIMMTLFILGGSAATIQAMQVNPPDNIEQVVSGEVPPPVVRNAVRTGNDSLLDGDFDDDFDDFFNFGRPDGRGRGDRRGGRGPGR